jgi:hypothetical protein
MRGAWGTEAERLEAVVSALARPDAGPGQVTGYLAQYFGLDGASA